LRRTLARRLDARRETQRATRGPGAKDDPFSELLGGSRAMRDAIDQARRVARHADVTVLVQGETGTGKELLARALHYGGPRASGPFVAVNCAAIPAALMESELFGHEKGAFTDAHAVKPGLFEEAHGGTLFLDEIGHLPLPLQGKLLRSLEDRRIRRVGATQSREVDVRIVAATHVDLEAAVRTGEFREDLYYRLNIVALTLPPLRDRDADIEELAEAFLTSLARRYGLPVPRLDTPMRRALRAHTWPGNVRELRHAMERALLLSEAGALESRHLAFGRGTVAGGAAGAIPFPAPLDQVLAAVARSMVDRHEGNKSAAARALGISRARLQRLLDRGEM